MDWLRDPIWQFIGALVGIVAIIISFVFFWKQQRQKNIAYRIISNTNLLNIKSEVKSKLQVLFEQKPVEKLSLLVIKIYNAGNEPILVNDFEKPILIEFGEKSEVLEAGIDKVSDPSMQPKIERAKTNLLLQPLLLNGGDSITLKIILAGFDEVVNVYGRIAGVKNISGSGMDEGKPKRYRRDLIRIYAYAVLGTFMATASGADILHGREILTAVVSMILGILVALIPIVGIRVVYNNVKNLIGD